MKKLLLVGCPVMLIIAIGMFSYNLEQGAPRQQDGLVEINRTKEDSMLQRGRYLVRRINYSDKDLQAIALYLSQR